MGELKRVYLVTRVFPAPHYLASRAAARAFSS